jgi:hypothetical protein
MNTPARCSSRTLPLSLQVLCNDNGDVVIAAKHMLKCHLDI